MYNIFKRRILSIICLKINHPILSIKKIFYENKFSGEIGIGNFINKKKHGSFKTIKKNIIYITSSYYNGYPIKNSKFFTGNLIQKVKYIGINNIIIKTYKDSKVDKLLKLINYKLSGISIYDGKKCLFLDDNSL